MDADKWGRTCARGVNALNVHLDIHGIGCPQDEISAKLQEMWPDAKGNRQASIAEFLSEIGTFRFSIKNDLDKGHRRRFWFNAWRIVRRAVFAVIAGQLFRIEKLVFSRAVYRPDTDSHDIGNLLQLHAHAARGVTLPNSLGNVAPHFMPMPRVG